MSASVPRLSSRSIAVLEMIAAGRSYEQILSAYPDLSYLDIFHAAEQALSLAIDAPILPASSKKTYTLAEKRERYPRAYLAWTDAEDDTLRRLVHSGLSFGCSNRRGTATQPRSYPKPAGEIRSGRIAKSERTGSISKDRPEPTPTSVMVKSRRLKSFGHYD